MYTITPVRVFLLLVFYAALWVIISTPKKSIEKHEVKTFLFIAPAYGILGFSANYLLFLAGVMSFLPWLNNFLHTFVWIGFCLGWLYLGSWEDNAVLRQFLLFAIFSFIVKYGEQLLFGTWEQDNFFGVLDGNFFYILGWSTADGFVPILTKTGLRIIGRWVPGLVSI